MTDQGTRRRDDPRAVLTAHRNRQVLAVDDECEAAEAALDRLAEAGPLVDLDEYAAAVDRLDQAERRRDELPQLLARSYAAWGVGDALALLLAGPVLDAARLQALVVVLATAAADQRERMALDHPPPPARLALVAATLTAAPPPVGGVRAAA